MNNEVELKEEGSCCSTRSVDLMGDGPRTTKKYETTVSVTSPEEEVVSVTKVLKYKFTVGYSKTYTDSNGVRLGDGGGGGGPVVTVVEQTVAGHGRSPSHTLRQVVHIDYHDISDDIAHDVLDILIPKLDELKVDWSVYLKTITEEDVDPNESEYTRTYHRHQELKDGLMGKLNELRNRREADMRKFTKKLRNR